jgi:hypothetical protein
LLSASKDGTPREKAAMSEQDSPWKEALDRQFDRLVYNLYGLTDEEIKIVEGCV